MIDFADIFLTDFAQVGFGGLDRSRSRWFKIRTYPNNDEIQVEATFSGSGYGGYYSVRRVPVVDTRGSRSFCTIASANPRSRVTIPGWQIIAWDTS